MLNLRITQVKFVIFFFSSCSGSINKYFTQIINISEIYDKTTEVLFIDVKEKKFLTKDIFLNKIGQLKMLWINLEKHLKSRMENYTIINSYRYERIISIH